MHIPVHEYFKANKAKLDQISVEDKVATDDEAAKFGKKNEETYVFFSQLYLQNKLLRKTKLPEPVHNFNDDFVSRGSFRVGVDELNCFFSYCYN